MNVCFVCHGNTCRSPMAEYIFKQKLEDAGIKDIQVTSAGLYARSSTSMSKGSQEQLELHNIKFDEDFKSQRFTEETYKNNNLIIALDNYILDDIKYICDFQRGTFNQKLKLLRSFSMNDREHGKDVFDPYGTDKYDLAYNQIQRACEGLFNKLCNKK